MSQHERGAGVPPNRPGSALCSATEEHGQSWSRSGLSPRDGGEAAARPHPAALRIPGVRPLQTSLPLGPPGEGRGHQLRGERGAAAVFPLRLPPRSRAPIFPDFLQMAAAGPWESEREEPVSGGNGAAREEAKLEELDCLGRSSAGVCIPPPPPSYFRGAEGTDPGVWPGFILFTAKLPCRQCYWDL